MLFRPANNPTGNRIASDASVDVMGRFLPALLEADKHGDAHSPFNGLNSSV